MFAFFKYFSAEKSGSADKGETDSLLEDAAKGPPSYTTTDDEEVAKEITNDEQIETMDDEYSSSSTTSSSAWAWYANLLERHPLLVKAVTAFFILGLGDAAAQGVEHLRDSSSNMAAFDWIRAIRFGAFGFLGAPWAHYYYYFLDYYFPPTEKPFTTVTALKLLIDQGLQAPALLALIISCLALLKGTGLDGVKADMQAHYMNTLIANCT